MFLSSLFASLAQAPAAESVDWIKLDARCTAIACEDVNNDGYDDLLATLSDGRLLVSYSLHDGKASEWKVLNEHAPPDTVGIAIVSTDRPPVREYLLVTPTKIFWWVATDEPGSAAPREGASVTLTRPGGTDASGKSLPRVPIRVEDAISVDGFLWVRASENDWWRLRTGASYLDGPYPDPRPTLLPVAPPRADSSGAQPIQARWKLWGDLNRDKERDSIAVFPVGRAPDEHLLVRVTFGTKTTK